MAGMIEQRVCPISRDPFEVLAISDCNEGIGKVRAVLLANKLLVDAAHRSKDEAKAHAYKELANKLLTDGTLHCFEQSYLEVYLSSGGRECPLCRRDIKAYILPPLTEEKRIEGGHRAPKSFEIADEKIYRSLFLIEFAFTNTGLDEVPENSFIQKVEAGKGEQILSAIRQDKALSLFFIQAFQQQSNVLKILRNRLNAGQYQNSPRDLLKDDIIFHLYNVLMVKAFEGASREAAQLTIGGNIEIKESDGDALLKQAEEAKKWRAIIGFIFALVTVFTVTRFFFQKCRPLLISKV